MSAPSTTWLQAARALARRVGRRERIGAALLPAGAALAAAALVTLALKAFGVGGWIPPAVVGAGLASALALALVRGRRVPRVEDADAAWALDRMAGADGRGLVAATVEGPVGGEAAWGPGRVDPPTVRLLPPRGLALCLAASLFLAVAVAVPVAERGADRETDPSGRASPTGAAAPGSDVPATSITNLVRVERDAADDAAKARSASAVREALGLTPGAARDPKRIAERLESDEVRRAALAAAPPQSGLGALLAGGGEEEARDLAAALGDGEEAARRAREARRQAARMRAEAAYPPIPPERRALLERYFARLGTNPDLPGPDDGAR